MQVTRSITRRRDFLSSLLAFQQHQQVWQNTPEETPSHSSATSSNRSSLNIDILYTMPNENNNIIPQKIKLPI